LPITREHKYIRFWESPNEPSIWIPEVLEGFASFTRRFIQRMHKEGLPVIVGQINTGWPTKKQIDKIGPGLEGADGLGLHEYAEPELWNGDGWTTLRYRRTRSWLLEKGYYCPPIYITELGIDRWDRDKGHLGWKTLLKPHRPEDRPALDRYAEQLAWYEREIQNDHGVVCATIFTAGPYLNPEKPNEWGDFEATEELMERFLWKLSQDDGDGESAPAPAPVPSPGPGNGGTMDDIKFYDRFGQREMTQAEWEAVFGPVEVDQGQTVHLVALGPGVAPRRLSRGRTYRSMYWARVMRCPTRDPTGSR